MGIAGNSGAGRCSLGDAAVLGLRFRGDLVAQTRCRQPEIAIEGRDHLDSPHPWWRADNHHPRDHMTSSTVNPPLIEWLPWNSVPIRGVAERLIALRAASGCTPEAARGDSPGGDRNQGEWDLSSLTVVVSGGRVERVLLWHLLALAEDSGKALLPPRIVSTGAIVDLVAPPEGRVATTLERELALAAALRGQGAAARRAFPVLSGHSEGVGAAEPIAAMVRSMEDRLDAAGVRLDDAATLARKADRPRWNIIRRIAADAEALLAEHGLALPWTVARSATPDVRDLILALVIEVPERARVLLREAPARGVALRSFVHAPSDTPDHSGAGGGDHSAFDEFGLLVPGAWTSRRIGIDPACVRVAEGALDAAEVTVGAALMAATRHAADGIVIGLVDPEFGPSLELAAGWAGVPVRLADGRPMRETQSWLLLDALAALLDADPDGIDDARDIGRAPLVAASQLVRLPAIGAFLERRGCVDRADSAPALIDRVVSERGGRDRAGRVAASVREILRQLGAVIAPLRGAERALTEWAEPIRGVLVALLADAPAEDPDEETVRAIGAALEAWSRVPGGLCDEPITAAQAIERLAEEVGSGRVRAPVRADAVDALGWLELHADDAPALVLLGLHEGVVPQADPVHPLLTPRIVRELGLPSDDQRLSRDAYLLEAMTRGRESVTVVVARRTPGRDPLLPSRLLLRGPEETLATRVLDLIDADRAVRSARPRGLPDAQVRSEYLIPTVTSAPPPASMSVTDFARYISCPFRYCLQRLLRLERFEEPGEELDAMEFGTLIHDVLHAFAEDPALRDSTDAKRIAAGLSELLDAEVARAHGTDPSPAIVIQREQVRARLEGFALWQAEHRRAGWCIDRTEWNLPDGALLEIPAADGAEAQDPMPLRGRIDRIDRHPQHGLLVIDYKTSTNGADPRRVHLPGRSIDGLEPEQWRDLQLPLYRHLLAATLDRPLAIRTAYVQLPRSVEATGLVEFEITEEAHEVAIGVARRIVRSIRAGEFPMNANYPYEDDFAAICQTNAFVAGGADDDDGEARGLAPGDDR